MCAKKNYIWNPLNKVIWAKIWQQKHLSIHALRHITNHRQLEETVDVSLTTQAPVHTCVSTNNEVIFSCRMILQFWKWESSFNCENEKYLGSIIDDSLITCDEIIDAIKTVSTNFNGKRKPVKQKFYIFYLPFFNYYSIIYSC